MFETYSQSFQDIFVKNLFGDQGTYVEIGSHRPKFLSNTYLLEVQHHWKGFGLELDISHQEEWEQHPERQNRIFWDNALTVNYTKLARRAGFTNDHFNYLSCDIEPPDNTFNALVRIIEHGFSFDVITFEHDRYKHGNATDILATEFLRKHGYKKAIEDVYFIRKNYKRYFETWYVNRKTVKFQKLKFNSWLRKNEIFYNMPGQQPLV